MVFKVRMGSQGGDLFALVDWFVFVCVFTFVFSAELSGPPELHFHALIDFP